ncbi:MAG: hypothetical protein PHE55_18255 [Methylococcaceae bacterium]|nr:hypothetical protein [Methylococcaceae bacterium]
MNAKLAAAGSARGKLIHKPKAGRFVDQNQKARERYHLFTGFLTGYQVAQR